MNIETISKDVLKLVEHNRRPYTAKSNNASTLGHECLRYLVYRRTAGEKAEPKSPSLAGVMKTGTDLHDFIKRNLSEAGQLANPRWRIVGEEQEIIDKTLAQYQISGRIDGILQTETEDGRWSNYGVVDIKTSSPNVFAGLDGIESLNRYPWTKHYIDQLTIYALGMNQERCCLIFVNKSNLFDIKTIDWPLDLGYAEELLAKARKINDHIASGELPEKINRPDICSRCEFAAHCMPDLVGGAGLAVADDAELAEMLQRRAELEPAKKEFDGIENTLKKRLIQGQNIICGHFVIEWKQVHKSIKAIPATERDEWHKKIIALGETGNAEEKEST